MMRFAVIEAYDCLVGVGAAMEYQNLGFRGLRCHNQIQREDGTAAALVALRPVIRPPVDLLHGIGEEGLFGRELGFIMSAVELADKGLVDVAGLACFKSENGGVANVGAFAEQGLVPFNPVVDDAVFSRFVVKEAVNVIHDDNINIQEQGRAFQIGESILSDGKFGENARPFMRMLVSGIRGERLCVNSFIKSRGVIRDADKTERTVHVFLDGTVKSIRVGCGITRAPLQADDVAGCIFAHSI